MKAFFSALGDIALGALLLFCGIGVIIMGVPIVAAVLGR